MKGKDNSEGCFFLLHLTHLGVKGGASKLLLPPAKTPATLIMKGVRPHPLLHFCYLLHPLVFSYLNVALTDNSPPIISFQASQSLMPPIFPINFFVEPAFQLFFQLIGT